MNGKIVVFDSGLGSLSIIKPIQRIRKSHIIYFADKKNFPYGKKPKMKLSKIINDTISFLEKKFQPDLIVIGSNTPTLLLPEVLSKKILGVLPPLKEAEAITNTKKIAILATESIVKSRKLDVFIKKQKISRAIKIFKINASPMVDLVESGKFIDDRKNCKRVIKKLLTKIFVQNNIDAATLSSTHLPFLKDLLEEEFPNVKFLDPGYIVAKKIPRTDLKRNRLSIYTNDDVKEFQKILTKINISNKVKKLDFN